MTVWTRHGAVHSAAPLWALWVALELCGRAAEGSLVSRPSRLEQMGYASVAWTEAQGLPTQRVQALAQARDGHLWIGTAQGLARFDGQRFTVFDSVNTPEMVSDDCTALAEDTEGALWVGTTHGLLVRRAGRFVGVGRQDGLIEDEVRLLEPSRRGGVWVTGKHGVHRWHAGGVERWASTEGLIHDRVYCLREAPDGRLWVGTEYGLQALDPGATRFGEDLGGAGRSLQYGVHGVWAEDGGAVWMYWSQHGSAELRRYESGGWRTYRVGGPVDLVGWPAWLVRDRRGRVWMSAGRHGLDCFVDGQFVRLTGTDGLAGEWVLSLIEDRDGNLWVGTEGGLNCWHRLRVGTVTTRDGLPNTNAWAVIETRDGARWIGTDGGLTKLTRDKATTLEPAGDEPRRKFIRALLEDREGRLWVGTGGGGIEIHAGQDVSHQELPGGLSGNKVRALAQTRDGSIWVGTEGGLHRCDAGGWRTYGVSEGLPHGDVRALLEDREGALWVGTYGGGVARSAASGWECFNTQDGLANDYVWAFCEGAQGVLWVASRTGLSWRTGGRWFSATVRDGLLEHTVNSVIEDGLGWLWFGGNRGVYRLRLADLIAFGAGSGQPLVPAVYGEADGMPDAETNGQKSQPAVWKSRDGRLWFPTVAGVAVFDPARLLAEARSPTVQIEEVRTPVVATVGPLPAVAGGGVRLPPGSAPMVEFHYSACAFTHPEAVRFRYRLEGLDADWIHAGGRRAAYYTHLSPGTYTFRLQACDAQGVWSESEARLPVVLAAPFHKTRTFQALLAGSVLAGAWLTYGWRARARKRLAALERASAVSVERERIARDLHDEVGATLTAVSARLELARRGTTQGVAGEVQQAQNLLEGAARTMSEIIWSADPRQDTLEATVAYLLHYAADWLEGAGLRCELVLPQAMPDVPLPAALRHDLLLVVKEALNNVVKHAGATRVRMSVEFERGRFVVRIEDNGSGWPTGMRHRNRSGHGVSNMRRRIEAHGGTFRIGPGAGQGTQVSFEVPLRVTRRGERNALAEGEPGGNGAFSV